MAFRVKTLSTRSSLSNYAKSKAKAPVLAPIVFKDAGTKKITDFAKYVPNVGFSEGPLTLNPTQQKPAKVKTKLKL